MKKMIIPIAILCAVIGLCALPNGKTAPVPEPTATSGEEITVSELVIELVVTLHTEIPRCRGNETNTCPKGNTRA